MEETRGDGASTIEGIRLIKEELPGVHTTLGLSNISFGLNPAARHVLNSVFLHECGPGRPRLRHRARGPHHPADRIPEEQEEVCLDLIYDRRTDDYDPLQELLEMFEGVTAESVVKEDRVGLADREAPLAAHHRRRPRRAVRRPRRGAGRRSLAARRSSTTCCSRA